MKYKLFTFSLILTCFAANIHAADDPAALLSEGSDSDAASVTAASSFEEMAAHHAVQVKNAILLYNGAVKPGTDVENPNASVVKNITKRVMPALKWYKENKERIKVTKSVWDHVSKIIFGLFDLPNNVFDYLNKFYINLLTKKEKEEENILDLRFYLPFDFLTLKRESGLEA